MSKRYKKTGSRETKEGILHRRWALVLVNRCHVELICFKCGRRIRVGSKIHVHHLNHPNNPAVTRIYHLKCWKKLFY
jgi:hypothetical protein